MDYRELLKKYMQHVGEQEGTYFLYAALHRGDVLFTEDEQAELHKIADELEAQEKKP